MWLSYILRWFAGLCSSDCLCNGLAFGLFWRWSLYRSAGVPLPSTVLVRVPPPTLPPTKNRIFAEELILGVVFD